MTEDKKYQPKKGFLSTINLEKAGEKMTEKVNSEFDLLAKKKDPKK